MTHFFHIHTKQLQQAVFLLLTLITMTICAGFTANSAAALSGSDFKAGSIIDNGTFFDGNAMGTGEIQAFLNAKVPTCRNGYTCLKNYKQDTPSKGADNYCSAYNGGSQKSAAEIIREVGVSCGVSQKTIMVLLQKEQSLVTDDYPEAIQYRSATGYGCPDTAACDSEYYGFFNQVYNAARQYKVYARNATNYAYRASRNNTISYNPNSSCGNSQVFIVNQATAGLYVYTPYQPNQTALNNLYGSGDSCSAYGNRNFWRLFNDWFGLTQSDTFMRVVSDDPNDTRQWVVYGTIKQHIPDAETIYAWNLQDVPLTTLPANYLNSFSTGPSLDRMARLNEPNNYALYFMDGGKRYRVPWSDMLAAWNLGGRTVSSVPKGLYDTPRDNGDLSYAIKPEGSSTIYMMDGTDGSSQTVIRPYQDATMFKAWEGDAATYTTIATSSGFFNSIDNAIGPTIASARISYGGDEFQVANGVKTVNRNQVGALYPGAVQPVSRTTYSRLPNIGNSTYLVQSANSPAVYLIDNGVKRHILWSSSLQAWGGGSVPITRVNDAILSTFSDGGNIGGYLADISGQLYLMDNAKMKIGQSYDAAFRNSGAPVPVSNNLAAILPSSPRIMTKFIQAAGDGAVYALDNSGVRHHLEWADKVTAWGGYAAGITVLSPYIVNDMKLGVSPATYVADANAQYFLDDGKKWILPSSVKAKWGVSGTPQTYTDGTLDLLPTAGTLSDAIKDTAGGYYYIRNNAANVSFDRNIGEVWSLDGGTQMSPAFIRSNFTQYMLTRFVKSSAAGDSRTFVIDRGIWYTVSPNQLANLGGINAPTMSLDPVLAPSTIMNWTYTVVKAGDGSYFVIDGGNKLTFNNAYIKDYWTNNGTIAVPIATNGFVNLLPTIGSVERAIKSNANGAIYAAPGAVKRHILYSSTYQQQYAPYRQVSNELLNALQGGADIP